MKTLKVKGMTCGHCEAAVREALGKVPGVSEVIEVDRVTERAVVEGSAHAEALLAAVTALGYETEISG